MKIRMSGIALIAAALLAGCGGGGGGSSTTPPVIQPTPTPTPVVTPSTAPTFPKASGKPMAFANAAAVKTAAMMRLASGSLRHPFDAVTPTPDPNATPTPIASPTPVPTPTPTPTARPVPTPTGLPQIPTSMAISSGFNLASGTSATIEVIDPATNQSVVETTSPTWISDKYWLINPTGVTPLPNGPTFQNAWSAAFQQTIAPPYHAQVAFTFPDSTGVLDIYSYDGFVLTQSDPGVTFDTTGVAKGATNTASADFYLDTNGIEAPQGIQRIADGSPNVFGDPTPALHNVASLPSFVSDGTTLTYGHVCVGCIYATKDAHGLLHKFMITLSDSNRMFFMQLGADVTGAFAF